MNKYQREKAKRMKRLAALGIGYYSQKHILRKLNPEQLDTFIDRYSKIKSRIEKESIFDKLRRVLHGLVKTVRG